MAEKKRKNRDENRVDKTNKRKPSYSKKKRERKGPRLPNALRKQLEVVTNHTNPNTDDEDINSDEEASDVYEYEEAVAEEKTMRNKRYDPVENFEYQLPDKIEDEDVASDDGIDNDHEDEDGDEDDGKHARILQNLAGVTAEDFADRKPKDDVVVTEAYPESEFNPTRDILDGDGRISMHDLLDPLHGKSGFSELRKGLLRMQKKPMVLTAPLAKPDRGKVERTVARKHSNIAISKWEGLIRMNREASTLFFDEDTDLSFSTVGAIASAFEPQSDFEKKMAAIINDNDVKEAHKKDGARLLELNKISVEDVKEHQNRLAKMRSLLFRHEVKAKRIKKIKSKAYHRLLKKDRLKASAAETGMDPEAAKELAMKQEFERAEERMTLKHKTTTKWAKRIIERGLDVQDEGTRAAFADQLHQHALLTRKMHTAKESSSDDSSDEDDIEDVSDTSDQDRALKVLERAKEKTIGMIEEEEEEQSNSGVLSLPFMVRGMQKRKEAANEEAKLALEEYESSLKQLDDKREGTSVKAGKGSNRKVFGAPKKHIEKPSNGVKVDNYYGDSDSEGNVEAGEGNNDVTRDRGSSFQKDVFVDPNVLRDESEIAHDSLFKSFNDIVKDPGPKTTYEVAMLASDSWKKMPTKDNRHANSHTGDANIKSSSKVKETLDDQDVEDVEDGSDSDSEGQMVDGILSAGAKSSYELPSQADLIRRAFAGDDVEDDFEKDKEEVLNEENPEPEKPVLLPGWGQWTNVQRKKGLPSWMVEEHESAKKKREEALKKRKDAHLRNVIISEKPDKQAGKFYLASVPYPFTSNEVYEPSIRMPIGPEFNPVTAFGALTRPEVVKTAGVIIKPIKYEDVDPHDKSEKHEQNGGKQGKKNNAVSNRKQKQNGARSIKNTKMKTIEV